MLLKLTNNVIHLPSQFTVALDPFVRWLRLLLPNHLSYVETDGLAVLLGKHQSKMETANDVGGEVYNFFSVMRDASLSNQLLELVSARPAESSIHHQAGTNQIADPVERAFQFFERCRRWMPWPTSPRADGAIPDRLAIFAPICQRFRHVQVEHLPVVGILQRYDSAFTCFMVDATQLPRQQLRAPDDGGLPALLDVVRRVKGRVLICGYADPRFDEVLGGWRKTQEPRPIGIQADPPQGTRFAWANYPDPRDVG